MQLSILFRLWSGQALEMRWIAGERLFQVLAESAPTGVRDADPAFWLTRLDALRLANRADQFDESRHRLLRHLRGVAAVVGAVRAATCTSASSTAIHFARRRCRW